MYKLLPGLKGKTTISLGCGSGEDCNYLKLQGAERVVGIDTSEKLIEIARTSYPDCDFQVMDMEQLDFTENSFDFAYSSLAIHYIENWHKVLSEVYRVLKPNSYFLFSCNHPVYSALETTVDNDNVKVHQLSRTKDKITDTVKVTGNYMSRQPIVINGGNTMSVTTWHKAIGEIANEVTDVGFLIANIVEPMPLPKMKEIAPKDFETLSKIPNFIIFKLLKY